MSIKVLNGNCLEVLDQLPEKSVDSCITSPPYYGLRDYNTGKWVGGDPDCPHKRMTKISKDTDTGHKNMYEHGDVVGDAIYKSVCPKCGATREDKQIGLEDSPEEYVESMVEVFRKVRRVLKDEGTVWLNLGDSYVSTHPTGTRDSDTGWKHGELSQGYQARAGGAGGVFKVKDLMGIPWMVAFALRADGWYLRQDIIWHKPNPMPESVTDRCTKAHEYIFLLSKNAKYYFDNESIKEDAVYDKDLGILRSRKQAELNHPSIIKRQEIGIDSTSAGDGKRNKRSVWTVTTKPFKGAHFAAFPPDLIQPCVLAGCPEKVCVECSTPYERKVESKRLKRNELPKDDPRYRPNTYEGSYKDINGKADAGYTETKDLGLEKQCQCETDETKSGTVLDPFGGAGTTGLVADRNDRNAILIELNDEYAEMARDRLYNDAPLFVDVE
jgi:DNA modification methylase